jgi:hypothetical protein
MPVSAGLATLNATSCGDLPYVWDGQTQTANVTPVESCVGQDGCIVSLITPTSSSLSASAFVSSLSLAEKASSVFLASYFLR